MASVEQLREVAPTDLPTPPFVNLPGLANLRDIGGYALASSPSPAKRSVRRGVVFRSADTSAVSSFPQSCADLTDKLNVWTVFDLRSSTEVTKAAFGPALNLPDVERVHVPMVDEDMSPDALAARYQDYAYGGDEGFVRAYSDLFKSGGPAVGSIARRLLDQPDRAVLVHCTAGKDRTGITAMLLLLLAGCAPATVEHEYALTTQGLAGIRERMTERLLQRPEVKGDRAAVERLAGSRASAMRLTLAYFAREYGTAREYLGRHSGLSEAELDRLRDILTSEEEPIFAD